MSVGEKTTLLGRPRCNPCLQIQGLEWHPRYVIAAGNGRMYLSLQLTRSLLE